jgi:hypothetical protein
MMPTVHLDARRRHLEAEMARNELPFLRFAVAATAIAAVLAAAIVGLATLHGGTHETTTKTPAKPAVVAINPSQITVQVFNGTLVAGLGSKYHDKVQALGFNQPVAAAQAPADGLKAESIVFYKPGQKVKAQLVRRKLGIRNIEPLDDVFAPLTDDATQVVIVVGVDRR